MTKQKRLKDIMVEKPPLQQATQHEDVAIVAEKKQLEELRQEIANKKAELADTKKQLGETLEAVRTAKSNLEDTKKLLEETFNKVQTITETMQKIIKDSCKMELTFKINDESRKEIQKYEKKATTDFKNHLNTFIDKVKKLKGQEQVLLTEDTFYTLVFLLIWFAPLAMLSLLMNILWLHSEKVYWIFFLYTALCALYIGIMWYLRYRRNHDDRNW